VTCPSLVRRGLAATLLVLLSAAPAAHAFDPTKDRETHLLSRSIYGGFPNGPSRNGAFSQDGQGATLAAFESDGSDLVPGDSNGVTDVFVDLAGSALVPDIVPRSRLEAANGRTPETDG